MLLALAQQLPQAYQVAEIQAMAAIRALEFRTELTEVAVGSVIVKGDFELVVKALKHDNPGLARMSCC